MEDTPMPINYGTLRRLSTQLGPEEVSEIRRLAKNQESLEARWIRRVEDFYRDMAKRVAKHLVERGTPPAEDTLEFEDLFVEHWFDVQKKAFKSISNRYANRIPARMAKRKTKTLKDLIREYDLWRKGKLKPKRPAKYAAQVRKEYLKRIHAYWKKNSERFLEGKDYTQKEAIEKIADNLDVTEGRAKTIVRTETTKYYNDVRRNYYDAVEDVTHYLFVALRDMSTTKWCKTRDGLVYKKGTKLLENETPSIHWNCRSEILPLDPDNPNHKKLIDDKSQWRENRSPEPLPKEFKRT